MKLTKKLAVLFLAIMATQSTSAAVLTFDDPQLPEPDRFAPRPGSIPDGYGGLNWNSDIAAYNVPGQGAAYYNKYVLSSWGYPAGVVSGERAALTWFANDIVMEGPLFTFNNAYFSAAVVPTQTVIVSFYNGATLVHSQQIVLSYATPKFFRFDVTNVTKVVIDPGAYQITIDDITINEGRLGLLDSDGDGVPDAADAFPHSRDVGANVTIDGYDTGVPSLLFPDGTTLSDLIYQAAAEARNHGQFVSAVAQLKNQLRKDSLLTAAQASAIAKGAARSSLP